MPDWIFSPDGCRNSDCRTCSEQHLSRAELERIQFMRLRMPGKDVDGSHHLCERMHGRRIPEHLREPEDDLRGEEFQRPDIAGEEPDGVQRCYWGRTRSLPGVD